jgi:hypothetical protein
MRRYIVLLVIGLLLYIPNMVWAHPPPGPKPQITEEDGSPIIYGYYKIKFANTNVTDNGDGTISIADQTGAGGGDAVTVNTTAATDANFLDNLYIDWAINTASSPDDITGKFNYAETLVGNPALLTTECVFTADGLLCEGTTADAIEIKLAFPDPVTTDKTLTLPNETGTLCSTGSVCTGYQASGSYLTSASIDTFAELDAIVADKALVNKADGAVWLGVHDFGGATSLEVPNGAPTVDTTGEIGIDTTDDQLLYMGGTVQRVIPYTYEKCFSLETPAVADDNWIVFLPVDAISITSMYCMVNGGTSAEIQISDGTNACESIVCDADGQADDGTIANGTFIANERMEFDTIAVTGTVPEVTYCIRYTVTAQ